MPDCNTSSQFMTHPLRTQTLGLPMVIYKISNFCLKCSGSWFVGWIVSCLICLMISCYVNCGVGHCKNEKSYFCVYSIMFLFQSALAFRDENQRIKTFEGFWSNIWPISPKALAQAVFFYCGIMSSWGVFTHNSYKRIVKIINYYTQIMINFIKKHVRTWRYSAMRLVLWKTARMGARRKPIKRTC